MPIRPRRSHRRDIYAGNGFLPFEQETFSGFMLNVPYARLMREDRYKLLQRAIKENWTRAQYNTAVRFEYDQRGIIPTGRFGKAEAYALLRWFEQQWRIHFPKDVDLWVSPSAKKSHHQSDFNHDKLLSSKRKYNDEHKAQRAEYRRTHRTQIAEARRKAKEFKRNRGQ